MEKLDFYGEMIYQDGWFVYTWRPGETCVLTREDAHMVENTYWEYQRYDDSVTGMQRSVEGIVSFDNFGFRKKWRPCENSQIELLAPVSASDVVIGDVLVIPEKMGNHVITSVLPHSFQKLSITKVVLPQSVKTVYPGAFEDCEKLTTIVCGSKFPDTSGAFEGCSNLSYENGFLGSDTTILKGEPFLKEDMVIPDGIKEIQPNAFSLQWSLPSVTFPDSIRSIDHDAFYSCTKLTEVNFPESLPELTLSERAFVNCGNLTSIRLPEGLRTIPEKCFWGCKNLAEVKIPASVEEIEKGAFENTKLYNDYLESGEDCLYIDNWVVDIKNKDIDELIIRDGTVGIACWAGHLPRQGRIGKIVIPPSLKYLNRGALSWSRCEHINLENVEVIAPYALEKIRVKELHVPATCRYFDTINLHLNEYVKEIFFYNPDTVIGTLEKALNMSDEMKIHGYKGSTAHKLCHEESELFNFKFVAMNKSKLTKKQDIDIIPSTIKRKCEINERSNIRYS